MDVINYSRQYPGLLFPGKTQYLENKSPLFKSERLIDSINPLNWFKVGKMLAKRKYELVIFRFWNPFFAPALGIIAGILRKKSPLTKLITLCDNVLPHENTPFGSFFTSYLFQKMHGHIVQSSQTEKEIHELIVEPVYEKRFHPLYDNLPVKMDRMAARKKVGITAPFIILYFGVIREYKGFDILLKAMAELKKMRDDFHLLAAGECYGNQEKYIQLIHELNIGEFVTWHNRYIPEKEVPFYFSSADVAALPYRTASQSGITQMAYHYNLPVIVTRVGGLPEIIEDGKSGFIISPEDPWELAAVLNSQLGNDNLVRMETYIQNYKQQFSWDNFVNGIEKLYSRL